MTFYHGSPTGALDELKPFVSEHGRPYIYFATDPLVALLYAVKPVPKPFSFYPYGFGKNGSLVYNEYFENAFYELYGGKTGYLYECYDLKGAGNPTQIHCAYACTEPVKVDRATEIADLYKFYMAAAEKGRFVIKPRSEISEKEMHFVFGKLRKELEKYNLKAAPEHAMRIFIKTHFKDVWQDK